MNCDNHIVGRFDDIPHEAYHRHNALSSHRLMPPTVAHWLARRDKETDALIRSREDHAALLEPGLCDVLGIGPCEAELKSGKRKGEPCGLPTKPGAPYCGTHGGDEYSEAARAKVEHAGRLVVTPESVATAEGVRAWVGRSSYAWVLDGGAREVTYRAWVVPDDSSYGYHVTTEREPGAIPSQVRFDIEHRDRRVVVDAKGCGGRGHESPVSVERFERTMVTFGYPMQAAFYLDHAIAVDPGDWRWFWLAHEKDEPYATALIPPDGMSLHFARIEIGRAVRRWAHYLEHNDPTAGWPTEPSRPTEMPAYARDRVLDAGESDFDEEDCHV